MQQRFKLSMLIRNKTQPVERSNLPRLRFKSPRAHNTSPQKLKSRSRLTPRQNSTYESPSSSKRLKQSAQSLKDMISRETEGYSLLKGCQRFIRDVGLSLEQWGSLLINVCQIYQQNLFYKDFYYRELNIEVPSLQALTNTEALKLLFEMRAVEHGQLASRIARLLNQFQQSQSEIKLLNQKILQKEQSIKALRSKLSEMEENQLVFHSKLKDQYTNTAKLQDSRGSLARELAKLSNQVKADKQLINHLQNQLKNCKIQNRNLKVSLADTRLQKLLSSKDMVLQLQQPIRDLLFQLKPKLKVIKSMTSQQTIRIQKLKQQLSILEKYRLRTMTIIGEKEKGRKKKQQQSQMISMQQIVVQNTQEQNLQLEKHLQGVESLLEKLQELIQNVMKQTRG